MLAILASLPQTTGLEGVIVVVMAVAALTAALILLVDYLVFKTIKKLDKKERT